MRDEGERDRTDTLVEDVHASSDQELSSSCSASLAYGVVLSPNLQEAPYVNQEQAAGVEQHSDHTS